MKGAVVRLIIFVILTFLSSISHAEDAPDYVGQIIDIVRPDIDARQFDLAIERADSPMTIGRILDQAPEAGQGIGPKRTLWLRVSAGVVMPDLHNLGESEARERLQESGITMVVSEVPPTEAEDIIVRSQLPRAGERIDASAEVATVVMTPQIEIPDFRGKSLDVAETSLGDLGLTVQVIAQVRPTGAQCDVFYPTMLFTNPPAGTRVLHGAVIVLNYEFEKTIDYGCLATLNRNGREPD